jgi:hypothetical protein
MDIFKVPSSIPQDLLLIHGLVNEPVRQPTPIEQKSVGNDNIDSSSEGESGDEIHEIETELLVKPGSGTLLGTSR